MTIPDWIARELPPGVREREVATRGERMHVLEWGPTDGAARDAHTIVMLHGNPTWSFLWRKVVAELRARPGGDQLRIVVPDLVGLGLSTKPPRDAHSIEHHAAWLGDVLDVLVPGPLVLVAQDWGGPIGMLAMADRVARLRGIVLANTAISPPAPGFKGTLFHRVAQMPVVSNVLFEWLGFPLGVLHTTQGDRSTIRGPIARAYRWPLRKRADRAAPLALARMVPDSPDRHPSLAGLRRTDELFRTAKVPIALVWGKRDPILGRVINHLERLRPDATVVRTEAGHFLQEEVPGELATAVLDVAARATWS